MGVRRFAVLGAVLTFLALAAGPVARADEESTPWQAASDWPMYGGSAGHTFANAAAPPARLGEVWRLDGNATLGSAVEADGFVYVADVDGVPQPAGPNLVVHRLAEVNGSEAPAAGGWTARVSLTPQAVALAPARTLAVDATRVYALFTALLRTSSEYQEVLAALNVADGSVAWMFNGTTPWTNATPQPTRSAAILIGSTVLFGSQDGSVYAVNAAANGALLWSYDTGTAVQSVPAAEGDIVYVTAGSRLLFLDLQGTADGTQGTASAGGGDLLDEVMGAGPTVGSPVVSGPYVYFLADDNLSAVDKIQGGQPIWSEIAPWLPFVGRGSPAIASSFVVVRRDDGRTYAYEAATGRITWIRVLPAAGDADMAFADGRLFLTGTRGGTGALVALDTAGDVLDEAELPSGPLGAPVPAGDKVLVASGSDLLAFRGQPDVAVLPTDIVLNAGQAANGVARGNLTVAVRNLGDEPAVGVRVRVYDGAEGPDNLIADFVVGNASDPVKAVGRSEGNFTATRDWSVGRHEILVVADPVAHEDVTGNNRAVAILYVEPGPPDTIVVGAGPYYLALLLGFVIGAAVLFLPLRRLRELRRKEGEKTS